MGSWHSPQVEPEALWFLKGVVSMRYRMYGHCPQTSRFAYYRSSRAGSAMHKVTHHLYTCVSTDKGTGNPTKRGFALHSRFMRRVHTTSTDSLTVRQSPSKRASGNASTRWQFLGYIVAMRIETVREQSVRALRWPAQRGEIISSPAWRSTDPK